MECSYKSVDLTNVLSRGRSSTDQGHAQHGTQDLSDEVEHELGDRDMARDHRRQTDGRVEVRARDAEKGPGGNHEADSKGKRLTQDIPVVQIEHVNHRQDAIRFKTKKKKEISSASSRLHAVNAAGDSFSATGGEIHEHGGANELSKGLDCPAFRR